MGGRIQSSENFCWNSWTYNHVLKRALLSLAGRWRRLVVSGCQRKTKSKTEARNLVCNHFSKKNQKEILFVWERLCSFVPKILYWITYSLFNLWIGLWLWCRMDAGVFNDVLVIRIIININKVYFNNVKLVDQHSSKELTKTWHLMCS